MENPVENVTWLDASQWGVLSGTAVLVMFLAWVNIAPLSGSDPAWWSTAMGTMAVFGASLILLSAIVPGLYIWYYIIQNLR